MESRRRPSRLRLFAFSLVVLLITAEVGLRFFLGNFAQSKILRHSENPEICLELRPSVSMPYTGWLRRVPATTMRTNSQGARGPEFQPLPAPGTLRVVGVGDSFTFGQGVEEDEAFLSVVGRSLRATGIAAEIINFGVPGHATPQEVALVRERVVPLQPDLVLLHVFVNDLTPEESYCEYGDDDSARGAVGAWLLQNVTLVRAGVFATKRFGHGSDAVPVVRDDGGPGARFQQALRAFDELGREHGFLTAVVLITDRQMYQHRCQGCPIAHDLVQGLPLHVIDMSPAWSMLQRDNARFFIPGEEHFSVEGSQIFGESLGGALAAWPALQRRVAVRGARP